MPRWLATRMAALGRAIVEAIALEWGRDEVLRRLAHPFWFQSFGAVMASSSLELLGTDRSLTDASA